MMQANRQGFRWLAVTLIGALALLSGCSTGSLAATSTAPTFTAITAGPGTAESSAPNTTASTAPTSPSSVTPPPPPVATVSASPAFGSTDVAPAGPVGVTVAQGVIDALTLTGSDGAAVTGALSADRTSWTVSQPLAFGTTYTAAGTATGTDGQQVPISGTFGTADPATQVRNTVYPGDDAVVGVAAPVIVYFGVEPADKAAVASHVTLTSDPAVQGAWAWIKHDDGRWGLDFRTKDYWPAGTKVHVSANLFGVQLAPGAYGAANITSDFTIGRNQVVIADVNSHELVVKQDGNVVASYPASYGRGDNTGDPNLITRSGTHIVSDFYETKLMSNPAYGYTNVPEKWAVRISDNGEFIHANPASSGAQGNSNVTHGCVNLSLSDAHDYYNSAIWGDPVEVTGTSVTLGPDDGDFYDWAMSWDQWQALSVA
jgi:lipoprotein-anchoring transpeptidase ErfK/SrfK